VNFSPTNVVAVHLREGSGAK